jgi:hypothetical protein
LIVSEILIIHRTLTRKNQPGNSLTTISLEKGLRFGTWNVQTLNQLGKLAQAGRIMESYSLAFMGMSEVRWKQSGQITTTKGHVFFWSGMPDKHHYGVGILVNRQFRKAIIDYKFIDERLMSMRFKGHQKNLTIIQCYAPTENSEDNIKDAFYDNLNATMTNVDKNDLVILMGDFNAKVGSDNENLQHVMGRHGIGEINDNGERLVELCGMNEMKIGGTLFPHKPVHKVTWVSPDNSTENQIDHICVSAKWSNSLIDVRNQRGADIASDHHLVCGKIVFKIKNMRPVRGQVRTKYNIERLKSQRHRGAFLDQVRKNLAESPTTIENVQGRWKNIKTCITDACVSKLGNKAKKTEDFISPQTWKLIDDRATVKDKINSIKDMTMRKQAQSQYRQIDKQVKRSVREDKREAIQAMTADAENAAKSHNMKDLFAITKKIAGTGNKRAVPVRGADGTLITNVDEQLKRWRDHFMNVLNIHRDNVTVTRNNNSNTLPIRTGPPSKREVTDAIKNLKMAKQQEWTT